ncbi:MAG: hypothetical protein R3B51_04585 [Thermodesulfobacteriota bacterium]
MLLAALFPIQAAIADQVEIRIYSITRFRVLLPRNTPPDESASEGDYDDYDSAVHPDSAAGETQNLGVKALRGGDTALSYSFVWRWRDSFT